MRRDRLLIVSFGLVAAFSVPAILAQAYPAGTVATATSNSPSGSGPTASTASSAASPAVWTIGLAQFAVGSSSDASGGASNEGLTSLRTVLPLLIAAELDSLPPHYSSAADRAAAAERAALQEWFGAGNELYSSLDARALSFLDPSPSLAQRVANILTADQNVAKSRTKLDSAVALRPAPPPSIDTPIQSALWDGNVQGRLIDPDSGIPSSVAKTNKVDLLIFGSLRDRSGYAEAIMRGYDAQLGKDVFVWTGYCSIEDPSPLARSFARKIEEWTAGKPFARLVVSPTPDSARIAVDGNFLPIGQRTIYRFSPGAIVLRVEAPGCVPIKSQIELDLGERKQVDVRLDPKKTGTAVVSVSPPEALISLDSLPKGAGPLNVDLNGTRIVASASAPGYEPGTAVLPKVGAAEVHIDLRPADGLGPGGRVDKAQDSFYGSLGLFVLSVPVTALTAGLANSYAEAAIRSGDPGLMGSAQTSQIALGAAIGASALLAINAVIHLITYLDSTR